jgi:hypothetical protein
MTTLTSRLQSTRKRFKALLTKAFYAQNSFFVTVSICQCRHFCAFKYGSGSFNPYENYIVGLHEGKPFGELQKRFIDFLMYYRPRDFAEVFDIELTRHLPLWLYPWDRSRRFNPNNGWLDNLDEVPDIITHFCERGIKRSRIEEEFFWLERAYSSISKQGFNPQKNTYIEALEFSKGNEKVYLLTDGNHRVSALAALGYKEVMIKVKESIQWDGENHRKWFQVRFGKYSEQDAINLFNVYFVGVNGFRRSNQPAKIIEDISLSQITYED